MREKSCDAPRRRARTALLLLCWLLVPAMLTVVNAASSGTVVAWGENIFGQTTVPASLSGVTAIAAGYTFSVALKSDGTVVAWGNNADDRTNAPAGLSGVTAIAASSHAMALRSDGTVMAWGYNGYGETNIPAGLNGVTAIAAGSLHSVAVKNDGTVVAWGYNDYGQTTVPAGLGSVTAVAGGRFHTAALKNNGTVVAWGYNTSDLWIVPAGLTGVRAIAAGRLYTVALKNDGTVVAWGDNYYGQTDVPAGLSGVTAIAAGGYHAVALKNDGTVVAWGRNNFGQTNVPAGLTGVTGISAGDYYTVAIGVVLLPPSIAVQPQGVVVSLNSNATFSVSATGTAPFSYQWFKDGVNLIGATNATLAFTNVQTGSAGNYSVMVSNLYGIAISSNAMLAVNLPPPPSILAQPQGLIVSLNSNATFSVTATGSLPLSYQWVKDGVNLVGATNATLTLTNTQSSSAGNYSVVVSNLYGSAISSNAMLAVNLPPPPILWAKKAGGSGGDSLYSMSGDGAGNVYIAGSFAGTATFGTNSLTSNGSDDIFIAKLDSTGNYLWARKAGSVNGDYANSVTVDKAGNVYVTGDFNGSVTFGTTILNSSNGYSAFIVKLDSAGNFLWATKPGGYSSGRSIAVDGVGNACVAGYFSGVATFGATTLTNGGVGSMEAFVAKLDTAGNFLWARRAGGNSQHVPIAVAADDAGNAWVAGSIYDSVTIGTNSLTGLPGAAQTFIAKLDSAGNYLWVKQCVGGTDFPRGESIAYSLAVDGTGKVNATGKFSGRVNFGTTTLTNASGYIVFVTQLDSAGNFLWATNGGVPNGNIDPYSVAVDGAGSVYVAGRYYSGNAVFGTITLTNVGASDAFVAKLDNTGHFLWALNIGGSDYDSANSVAVDGAGDVLVGGVFRTSVTLGTTTLISTGSDDVFIAKLGTPPNIAIQPASQFGVAGSNVLLSISITGTTPLFYQWQKDGQAVTDATNSTLNLTNLARASGGIFSVFITNQLGTATSSNATVRVLVRQQFAQAPVRLGNGQMRLVFGDPLSSALTVNELTNFIVEATTNVPSTNWIRYTNGFSIVGGMVQFDDADAPGSPRRFYRVIER